MSPEHQTIRTAGHKSQLIHVTGLKLQDINLPIIGYISLQVTAKNNNPFLRRVATNLMQVNDINISNIVVSILCLVVESLLVRSRLACT
jgi:hypothetical protein